jgi:hypothetical protein
MPELLNSKEEVEAVNQAQAAQAQQQQQLALAGAAIDKAKTLADAKTGEPNALTDIVGMSPNAAAQETKRTVR